MKAGKVLLGVSLLLLGVVLLLDREGALDAGRVVAVWWPLPLLLVGCLELAGRPRNLAAAVLLGGSGLVLLSLTSGVVTRPVFGVAWPLALVAAGLWLTFGRRPLQPVHREPRDDFVDVTAVFSGREVVSRAAPFRGGSATAVFGGIDLDLRDAELADGATLHATAVFGDVNVLVPPAWLVHASGSVVLGGDGGHEPAPDDAPVLKLQAHAMFGAVAVTAAPAALLPLG